MSKYLLTIHVEFDALDDVEARHIAREIINVNMNGLETLPEAVRKLQKIETNKPPRKVEL
jgi:hypothetical protein